MRVILSGGGTGGHINPAIAIAKRIKASYPDAEIAFIGTPAGMENRLVSKEGFKIYHVKVRGFQRRFTLKNIDAARKAVTSVIEAKKIIKKFKPDIVIGTGGYVSWPALKAASSLGIKTLIHEQNAFPGVTSRKLAQIVDRVLISFRESEKYFKDPSKLVLVGNPLRPEFLKVSKEEERERLGIDKPYLFSVGGSLGAHKLNDAVLDLIRNYSAKSDIRHTHIIGGVEWEERKEEIDKLELAGRKNVEVLEFSYDMASRLAAADLVISRVGAITLAELAVLGKPCILIPSPNVAGNHQYKNALVAKNAGGAVLIEEKDLTGERLIKEVNLILNSPEKLKAMSEGMKKIALPEATDKIFSEITELLKK